MYNIMRNKSEQPPIQQLSKKDQLTQSNSLLLKQKSTKMTDPSSLDAIDATSTNNMKSVEGKGGGKEGGEQRAEGSRRRGQCDN